MAEVSDDYINDKHVPMRGGYIALQIDHTVLDVAHGLLLIKLPLFVVVVPSVVRISAAPLKGSAVHIHHHPGQEWGLSLGKHKHCQSGGAIPLA